MESVVLSGEFVSLEPLSHDHVNGLVEAAAADPSLYRWSLVPQGDAEVSQYVEKALAGQAAGSAVPFAIVRLQDGAVIGSTRFFDISTWQWPPGHARFGSGFADTCEIGYTWLTRSAVRTAANTEVKLLMLTHAFETWRMLRVCFYADARNQRSRSAIERIGGTLEGILRSHRMASDYIPRDSACYSIVASEWPEVKRRLNQLRDRKP
jgi:RimJ/RimL family protein N-acetyltransferase